MAAGYHGRYLRIVAGGDRPAFVPLAPDVLRAFLGGVGLGTWILAHETPPGADPLGPSGALVFALSPLVGTPLTTSAKFAVVGISPLTGRTCDALSSSHFALAAKRAGVDAIVIAGTCAEPSLVFIDGDERGDGPRIGWEPAGSLWGQPARRAEEAIRERYGADWQVAAIGPAGERRIPLATISHDGRHAGRGGLGAVLGAKRIKAIAVRGSSRTGVADPAGTIELARRYSALSLGRATEKYRELGTVANLLTFNRLNALPTRNFRAGRFEGAGRLAADGLGPAPRIARNSCAACTIGCEHIYPSDGGGVRLEYESLFALGPLCGVDDPAAVLRAARACDDAGLDTISTGATIAFLTDCAERGLHDLRLEASGRPLRFGDGDILLEAIETLAARRGRLGCLLAAGSRAAAAELGGEAIGLAPHVKGLELPGYDPRRLHAMALGLAVGTRGADHNRSAAYEADFSGRVRPGDEPSSFAAAAVETEDRAALMDSLILCKFLRGVFEDFHAEAATMLRAVTGWDVTADELRTVGRRIVNARKCLNGREGWTAAEDTLPARFLSDSPVEPGGPSLSRDRLEAMIAAYYRNRGWDAAGRVPASLRRDLGLDEPAFGG